MPGVGCCCVLRASGQPRNFGATAMPCRSASPGAFPFQRRAGVEQAFADSVCNCVRTEL
jgi:hypothetical protein